MASNATACVRLHVTDPNFRKQPPVNPFTASQSVLITPGALDVPGLLDAQLKPGNWESWCAWIWKQQVRRLMPPGQASFGCHAGSDDEATLKIGSVAMKRMRNRASSELNVVWMKRRT